MTPYVEFEVGRTTVRLDPSGGERVCPSQLDGGYEPESLQAWSLIANAGTVLDIGAYSGLYSIAAAKIGADRVIAFEPLPIMVDRLRANLVYNFVDDLVAVVEAAVSDRNGTAEIKYTPAIAMTAGASLTAASSAHPLSMRVKTVRIDDMQFSNVRAIKIDANGHDLQVIAGAIATINKWRPKILVECLSEKLKPKTMDLLPSYQLVGMLDGRNLLLVPQ